MPAACPCACRWTPAGRLRNAAGLLLKNFQPLNAAGTFPRDLIARQPDLRVQAGQSMPVRIRHLRDFSSLPPAGDAALELLIADDGACLLRINTAVVDAAYGESLKNQLTAFLHAAAGGMHRPLDRLPLASEAEKRRIIEEWNATAAPFAEDVCMHELFERQALVRPDSTATVFEDTSVSYGELNRRANALAWHLRQQGVGRGSLVGICLDRSHDMIAALLAILKAGGAYVPLEPSYPLERIQAIVRSAGVKVIVSQEKACPSHRACRREDRQYRRCCPQRTGRAKNRQSAAREPAG